MHRLTVAALSAAILLAACTEKTPEAPTGPSAGSPSLAKAATGSCQTPFPLTDLLMKTGSMFGGASVRHAADAKIQTIESQCDKGKVGNARHEALSFVDWMLKKYGQNQLPQGTASDLAELISTLFVAVGFQDGEVDPGAFGPRGAAGMYTGDELLLQNADKSAAVLIPGGSCLPNSFISLIPLPNSPQLVNTGGRRQFAPFYDINAANADGDHTLATGCTDLLVGWCVDQAVLDQTDNPQIGHNPSEQEQEEREIGDFEVLRALNSEEYARLDLEFCPGQANTAPGGEIDLGPGGGLEGLALSAWHKASGYIRPLTNFFLPQQLHATTLGGLGMGNGGRGISTFGGVDDVVLESSADPGDQETSFFVNEPISWYCGDYCFPEVRVRDFFNSGVSDADVSVTLIRLEGEGEESTVEFGEGSELTETTNGSGKAVFDNLIITEEGTYLLEFTVPGNELPLRSGSFFVSEGE